MASAGQAATARGQSGSSSIERPDYWWYGMRSRLLESVFASAIPKGALVLDVGSADGPSVGWMRDISLRVPVDIDPRGLQPGGICTDALRLPFADGAFDVVAAFDVIEHFADEPGVIAELVRVLRPSGILAVSVPAYQWAWTPFDVAAGHYRRYTRARLRRAVGRAPVETVRLTHAFAGVFPFFALARLADRLRPTSPSTTLPTVPSLVEWLLLQLGRIDEVLLPHTNLPFGSSIFMLARKV